MAAGSIGGFCRRVLLLAVAPSAARIPILTALLIASAVKVWRRQ